MSVLRWVLFFSASLLFFSCGEQVVESFTVSGLRTVTAEGGRYSIPRFSPDGKRILFTGAKNRGLYTVSVDGGDMRQLSDLPGEGYGASFSPDGTYVASYVAGDRRFATLYSVDSGKRLWKKEIIGNLTPPTWSKGSPRWFVRFSHQAVVPSAPSFKSVGGEERAAVWTEMNKVMISRDGSTTVLTDGYAAQLSPDGTKVLFKRDGVIYVRDLTSGDETRISRGDQPSWYPDSQSILFVRTTDNGETILSSRIFSAAINGSQIREMSIGADVIPLYPAISSDKTKIVFADEKSGAIMLASLNEGGRI